MPDEYKLVNASRLERSLQYEADQLRAKLGTEEGITFDMENERAFGDAVRNIPSGSDVFVARINSTTSAEIEAAYQAGKAVLLPIPRTNAIARLTGRDDAVTHHFGAVFSDSNAEDLVAVHVTCVSDSWRAIATTLLANRATISSNKFSPETTYSVGDYVLYRGFLYRFTAAHTGAWAAGDTVRVQLAEDVKDLRTALDGKGTYSKPSDGIPKTDLDAAVQTSLGKADTALQEHQSLSGYATQQWVGEQGYLTSHQDISGKANVTSVPASASVSSTGVLSFANNTGAQLFTVQLPLYAGGVS